MRRLAATRWPISGASIEIGLRAYGDTGWLTATMARLEEDCEELDAVIEKLGMKVIGGTPQQYATVIHNELAKWTKLVKAAGIRAE